MLKNSSTEEGGEVKNGVSATWQQPLPEDEIGRQQAAKERLQPQSWVTLRGLGVFVYAGCWDTMHNFYPEPGAEEALRQLLSGKDGRYVGKDLRGKLYLRLPYTLLADYLE